jgi:hypothetical protein
MYADNINELLDLLCNKFDPDLRQNFLTGSTNWDSAILYPVSLKGKQLFKLTPTETFKEPKTFFDKLLSSMGFGGFDTTKCVGLTEEAKNEVTNASGNMGFSAMLAEEYILICISLLGCGSG